MKPLPRVRPARAGDLAALPPIELAAAQLFREAGLAGSYLDETLDLERLGQGQRDGRLFVAVGDDGAPTGFALLEIVDGHAHLEEVDVHPAAGRQGIGRALVDAACAWAAARGDTEITLATFSDLAWNAPFYARLGFVAIAPEARSPGLRALEDAERAKGLPMERRVMMRRALTSRAG